MNEELIDEGQELPEAVEQSSESGAPPRARTNLQLIGLLFLLPLILMLVTSVVCVAVVLARH